MRQSAHSVELAGTHFTVKVEGGIIPDGEVLRAKPDGFGLQMVEPVAAESSGSIMQLNFGSQAE